MSADIPEQGSSARGGGWGNAPGGEWVPPGGPQGQPTPGWTPPPTVPPAPKPGVVPLRPLSFGDILDGAFTTIQRYPAIMLGLSAAVFTVLSVIDFLLARYVGLDTLLARLDQDPESIRPDELSSGLGSLGAYGGVLALLQWVVGTILTGIITVTVSRGVLGEPVSIQNAWRAARGRLLPLAGLSLLIALVMIGLVGAYLVVTLVAVAAGPGAGVALIIIGLVALLFFIFFFAVRWAVAASALVLETRSTPAGPVRIGVTEAMGRSWRLIKGQSWRTFGVIVVAGLIAAVVAGVLQYAFTLLATAVSGLGDQAGEAGTALLGGIGAVSGGVLQLTFISAVNVLIYTDARMRREGLDIELTAAVDRRSAHGTGPGGPSGTTGPSGPSGPAGPGDGPDANPPEAPWKVS